MITRRSWPTRTHISYFNEPSTVRLESDFIENGGRFVLIISRAQNSSRAPPPVLSSTLCLPQQITASLHRCPCPHCTRISSHHARTPHAMAPAPTTALRGQQSQAAVRPHRSRSASSRRPPSARRPRPRQPSRPAVPRTIEARHHRILPPPGPAIALRDPLGRGPASGPGSRACAAC